jgi:hypothetical protein
MVSGFQGLLTKKAVTNAYLSQLFEIIKNTGMVPNR